MTLAAAAYLFVAAFALAEEGRHARVATKARSIGVPQEHVVVLGQEPHRHRRGSVRARRLREVEELAPVLIAQAQESGASAQLDYINSLFAHNLAKLSLARAIGRAAEKLPLFLKIQ